MSLPCSNHLARKLIDHHPHHGRGAGVGRTGV